MSYANPAPFEALKRIADAITESVKALESHPEGTKAFEKWMDDMDFSERFNTRYKDLPVDDEVPETMVLVTDFFSVVDGRLYVESKYSRYVWNDGGWEADED